MKYFVLSLHRVGTQSTHQLLTTWKIRSVHHPITHNHIDLRPLVVGHETDLDHVFSIMRPVYDAFDAVSDVPTPVLYQQLAAKYPNAKFILLHRDPLEWVASVRKLIGVRNFTRFERVVYWRFFPNLPNNHAELTDHQLMQMHQQHTDLIVRWFGENCPNRLGTFHLNDPDIANKMSRFLGRMPIPFPRADAHQQRVSPTALHPHPDVILAKARIQ